MCGYRQIAGEKLQWKLPAMRMDDGSLRAAYARRCEINYWLRCNCWFAEKNQCLVGN